MGDTEKGSDLVKTQTQAPAHIKRGGQGLEQVKPEELIIPRLRLSQALSTWVREQRAKEGEMVNSLDPTMNYGNDLVFIPLAYSRSRIRWTPRDEGPNPDAPKGLECVSNDGVKAREAKGQDKEGNATDVCEKCVLQHFGEGGKPPRCTLYKNVLSMLPDHGLQVISVSFERTKIKEADRLLTLASMLGGGGYPLYAGRYRLKTKEEKNARGEPYWNFVLEAAGWTAEAEYPKAEQTHEALKKRAVEIHMDEQDHAEGSGEGSGKVPF